MFTKSLELIMDLDLYESEKYKLKNQGELIWISVC